MYIQIHFYISEIHLFISADGCDAMSICYFDHMFVTKAIAITEQSTPS